MSNVYVVRSQLGHYWGKQGRWVDGRDAARVLPLKHRDEGLNLLVELSAQDIDLRGEVAEVPLDDKNLPQVEPSQHLLEDEIEDDAKDEGENGDTAVC